MRPSSPIITLFFLFCAGFLISGALTPSVSGSAPEVFPNGFMSSPSSLPLPLPYGSGDSAQANKSLSKELVSTGDLSDSLSHELLPDYSHGKGPGTRSLLCSDADKHDGFLLASLGGTILSMDSRSRVHWELSTGSPLSYSEQAHPNLEYYVYSDDYGRLWEYNKGCHREYGSTIEEYVHRTPDIKGSTITLGSKVTALFFLDNNGTILHRSKLPVTSTAVGWPWVEDKLVSSKLEIGKSYILLVRTDYSLSSVDLGIPLWHVTVSRLRATYIKDVLPPNMGDKLVPSPLCQGDIPVIFLGTAGKLTWSSYGDNMLPPASDFHNLSTSYVQNDKQVSLNMPQNPFKTANYCSLESIPATEHSVPETRLSLQSHFKTEQSDDKYISSNSSNKLNVNFPYDDMLSVSENLYKNANRFLVENSFAAKQNFTYMFPGAMYGIFIWFMIPSLLIFLALCYMKFREPVKDDKQLNNLRGRQSLVPKKRKARKAGNMKNGAIMSNHERNNSSEKENAETNGHTHIQSDELHSLTDLMTSVDAGDGRWVGKLFVSNSEIGRGSNGTVVLEGVYDGRPVAVKRLLRAHHDVAFKEIQNLIASDRHPNIVRWYGAEQDLDFVYISLERCTCSLSDLIQLCSDSSFHSTLTENSSSASINKHKVRLDCGKGIEKDLELWTGKGFPSSQLLKLMRDVVSGLAHLHELGIIHRDMKPQNVLVSKERHLNAKLSDMGISKRLLEDMSSLSQHATGYGSSGWQAPEQLLHGRQTRAMDLFSLGCILFFCITKGKHPFGNYFERDSNILNNRIDLFLVDHIPEAVHLLSQLLNPNPKMRPNAVEVLHHPLFWSSEMRLTFLRDTSDRIELEDRENESELLKALENVGPVAFGGKWGEKLDAAFITDMGRYRKYNFDCIRDLLRVIRNKLNHYRELPKELQENLGSVPGGFDRYFTSRFPKLLIEVYRVVYRYCREEDWYSKYFMSTVV